MKKKRIFLKASLQVYERICKILDSAKNHAARSVNTAQVGANWLIGREIVEEEQKGKKRAGYGEGLIRDIATQLQIDYGKGYSLSNVKYFKQFYLEYPGLYSEEKSHAVSGLLERGAKTTHVKKSHAVSGQLWKPGMLNPNISWTHYRTLLRVELSEARAFYEIEAVKNSWSARELERQINSLLYERLALSRDKKAVMKLALKGYDVQKSTDVFKDPVVMEFIGLPESPKLVESSLEQAIIDNLQLFLLEMGKGFAFVSRQERLTLEGDHFYIDLVFYHTVLKCFIIIEIKTGKLTHQDIGQLQLYVNYYDRERCTKGDNPTLGLILCADKNDTVVKYTLGKDQNKTIFASRYKLYLPSEAELKAEIQREVRFLSSLKMNNKSKCDVELRD